MFQTNEQTSQQTMKVPLGEWATHSRHRAHPPAVILQEIFSIWSRISEVSNNSKCVLVFFLVMFKKSETATIQNRMFPSLLLCLIKDIRSQRRFNMFPGIFLGRVQKSETIDDWEEKDSKCLLFFSCPGHQKPIQISKTNLLRKVWKLIWSNSDF